MKKYWLYGILMALVVVLAMALLVLGTLATGGA